jgi:hypothetical protein
MNRKGDQYGLNLVLLLHCNRLYWSFWQIFNKYLVIEGNNLLSNSKGREIYLNRDLKWSSKPLLPISQIHP